MAYSAARSDVERHAAEPVPLHLRNASTKLMESEGYGEGYRYAHDDPDAVREMRCMPEALGEVFNVGSATETTIHELAEEIIAVTNSPSTLAHVPYEVAYGKDFADTRRRVPDVGKAEQLLGWRSTVALRDGLLDLVAERAEAGVPGVGA